MKDNQILTKTAFDLWMDSMVELSQAAGRLVGQEPKKIAIRDDWDNYQVGFNRAGKMYLLDWGSNWFAPADQNCEHRISAGECIYCGLVIEGDE